MNSVKILNFMRKYHVLEFIYITSSYELSTRDSTLYLNFNTIAILNDVHFLEFSG